MIKRIISASAAFILIFSLTSTYFNPKHSTAAENFNQLSYYTYSGNDLLGQINIGDINGDGYDDFAVNEPGFNTNVGRVMIHLGGKSLAAPDYTLVGVLSNYFGSNVIGLGKYNNDAYDDLAICESTDVAGSSATSCYIYFGGSPFDITFDTTIVKTGTIGGRPSSSDANNDGYNDLFWPSVSVSSNNVDIFYGGSGADNASDFQFALAASKYGATVFNALDFNGDGYNDFALFSVSSSGIDTYLDLYFGRQSGQNPDTVVDVELASPAYADSSNIYLSNFINDINNDGNSEWAFWNIGTYEIYFGGSSVSGTPDATISAVDESKVHTKIASAGDINNDGIKDIVYSYWVDSDDSHHVCAIYGASDISGLQSPDLEMVNINYPENPDPYLVDFIAADPRGDFTSDTGYEFLLMSGWTGSQSVYYYQIGQTGAEVANPSLTLTSAESETSDTTPTFTGTATADATRTIAGVSYRVDGGAWQDATATDGNFNEQIEDYSFTTSVLSVGSHTIESKATDNGSLETLEANFASFNITITESEAPAEIATPTLTLNTTSASTSNTTPTFTGTATADATRTIAGVSYRIDGGAWESATASDSSFDTQVEDYAFTTSALSVGSHTIESKATDNGSLETIESGYPSITVTITEPSEPPIEEPEVNYDLPALSLDTYPAEFATHQVAFSGKSWSDSRLNIHSVQYSFNKDSWYWTKAEDGNFNGNQENFSLHLNLVNGDYLIYFRAEDNRETFTQETGYAVAQFTVKATDNINNDPELPQDGIIVPSITTPEVDDDPTPPTIQNIVTEAEKPLIKYSIIAATIALLSMASLALGSLLTQISAKEYLMVLINSFLSLFAKQNKDKFGIVYDSTTDQPVSGALVNIFQFDNMKLISSSLTDNKGHFYFTVSQGKYVISVIKSGYIFPSLFAPHAVQAVEEARGVYFGQTLDISDEVKVINVKIPIDPSAKLPSKRHKLLLLLNSTAIRLTIMSTATLVTIFMLLYHPSTASYLLALLYSLLWILEFFIQDHELRFSRIIDASTSEPVDLALVRVIDKDGKLRKTYVSDYRGRVIPYISNRQDRMTIERINYQNREFSQLKAGFLENNKLTLDKNAE